MRLGVAIELGDLAPRAEEGEKGRGGFGWKLIGFVCFKCFF